MLLHFRARDRSAIAALWAIDEAMREVVRSGASQPALAAIKLAWWREALERLDKTPAPPEPRLQAVANDLLPRGVSGRQVAGLEPGWTELLQEQPRPDLVASRGRVLFGISALLVAASEKHLEQAGELVALTDAIRMGKSDFADARRASLAKLQGRIAHKARPITLAARLAARDPVEPEGTPLRALSLIGHRLTGIIARAD